MTKSAYTGVMLRTDLSTGKMRREDTAPYRRWIGGMGVGEKILYDEVKPWMTPYDPGNRIILGTGALNGTIFPGSGRVTAVTKSPMTMGMASGNAGGHFSAAMKYAGFDHIVLEGRSAKPVYLWICDGEATLLDATPIIGKTVTETDDWFKRKHGEQTHTFSIGPAGENLARCACVMVDKYHAIGKSGFGAVMGSKNIKAIAVQGSGGVSVYDESGFFKAVDAMYRRVEQDKEFEGFLKYGTLGGVRAKAEFGGYVYRHGQDLNIPEEMCAAFEGKNACAKYRERQTSCAGCMIGCQNRFRIEFGPYAGLVMEGASYNGTQDFGTKLGISDFAFVIKATALCDDLGIDIDVAGEIVGWAMECLGKDILRAQDFDGLEPRWGNQEVALELIRKMAYRDGVGAILSEGVARASAALSKESCYYAGHMKGNDLYETMRSIIGYALGSAVSPMGGGHVLGSPLCETQRIDDHELAFAKYGVTTYNDPHTYSGKPELVKYYEILDRACSSMGLCLFVSDWEELHLLDLKDINRLLKVTTGTDITVEDFKDTMLALVNLERVFNYAHAGFTRVDDYPPERFFEEKAKTGPAKGACLDKQEWDDMLDVYYDIHGWNRENGLPTPETLRSLGLEFALEDLSKPAQAPGRSFL